MCFCVVVLVWVVFVFWLLRVPAYLMVCGLIVGDFLDWCFVYVFGGGYFVCFLAFGFPVFGGLSDCGF